MEVWHGTTIIGVRKNGKAVIAGDGQVSLQSTVIKPNAQKGAAARRTATVIARLRRRDRRRLHPVRAAGAQAGAA